MLNLFVEYVSQTPLIHWFLSSFNAYGYTLVYIRRRGVLMTGNSLVETTGLLPVMPWATPITSGLFCATPEEFCECLFVTSLPANFAQDIMTSTNAKLTHLKRACPLRSKIVGYPVCFLFNPNLSRFECGVSRGKFWRAGRASAGYGCGISKGAKVRHIVFFVQTTFYCPEAA